MSEAELEDIEVGGTRRVIDACVTAGVGHLTVTSSGAAYGYHPRNDGHLLTEDESTPGSPEFAYSRHKAAVERLVERARRLHPELGVLLLRPGTIIGAGHRQPDHCAVHRAGPDGPARERRPVRLRLGRGRGRGRRRGEPATAHRDLQPRRRRRHDDARHRRVEGKPLIRVPAAAVRRGLQRPGGSASAATDRSRSASSCTGRSSTTPGCGATSPGFRRRRRARPTRCSARGGPWLGCPAMAGRRGPRALAGAVAVVTGAGGQIGRALMAGSPRAARPRSGSTCRRPARRATIATSPADLTDEAAGRLGRRRGGPPASRHRPARPQRRPSRPSGASRTTTSPPTAGSWRSPTSASSR